jgi:malate dehydrogenase (oxaloacetate-decarboxylating)
MNTNEKALLMHEQWQGKLEINAKAKVNSKEDLSIAYTPGVAEPCRKINENIKDVYKYTMKGNTIAVISDGTAVLG